MRSHNFSEWRPLCATTNEVTSDFGVVDLAKHNHKIIHVPEKLRDKLNTESSSVMTKTKFIKATNEQYSYSFLQESDLSQEEINILNLTPVILELAGKQTVTITQF